MKSHKTAAIIAAGGSSSRMGFDKLMAEIAGEKVLFKTISAFEKCDDIDEIIIVTRTALIGELKAELKTQSFKKLKTIVSGGETRQKSVYNGVLACSDDVRLLCIHDGARPLVTDEVIKNALKAAIEYGAATAAVAVKDTIKRGENKIITETLPRENLYQIQTPQVFDKQLYLSAYKAAKSDYSDDCQLIEAMGGKVALSMGDYHNIKLTTNEDFAVAEIFLRQMED